ncbi:MAG TPA: hypothetical protein VJ044_03690, partial [Candidatus Hodarchaeales archaeon]|nr:hypothetical protein [Candidatus Hodarchaeales archaeon]
AALAPEKFIPIVPEKKSDRSHVPAYFDDIKFLQIFHPRLPEEVGMNIRETRVKVFPIKEKSSENLPHHQ